MVDRKLIERGSEDGRGVFSPDKFSKRGRKRDVNNQLRGSERGEKDWFTNKIKSGSSMEQEIIEWAGPASDAHVWGTEEPGQPSWAINLHNPDHTLIFHLCYICSLTSTEATSHYHWAGSQHGGPLGAMREKEVKSEKQGRQEGDGGGG